MKEKKKAILYINPFCRPSVGGAETLLDEITSYVRSKGYFVYILTYQPLTGRQRGKMVEKGKNLEIHRYQWFGTSLFVKFSKMHPAFNFLYLFPYLFVRSFIFMLNNRKKVDVIDTHGFVAALIAKLFKPLFGKKTVMTIVAYYGFDKESVFAKVVKWILESADKIIVESPQSRVELKEIGVDPKRITPFTEWIDLKRFKPYDKKDLKSKLGLPPEFTVLFVGRAIKVKGVDILLKTADSLKNEAINFVFISTAGDLIDFLESESIRLKNVTFINGVDYLKLHLYYAMADIFVVPSRMEDAPRTAVEAIACGTPAIGSDVGGIPSVINSDVGMLVDPKPDEFKKAILALYRNKNKLDNLTEKCRPYAVKNFSSKNGDLFVNSYN